ncbi:hypothetical protein BJ138DRAFT_102576 [Hygrophoropsis aurantiaca]|uniref:Uncharacterized protein n=1 Tax=Hygrophoropsis aurantiaca TaxID=72124 RepID=A0ACB7ZSC3_9AGAM|nr:hypothetical protein BJ138DRAFT_102576 [Hygrophoropsis aurantiaca]
MFLISMSPVPIHRQVFPVLSKNSSTPPLHVDHVEFPGDDTNSRPPFSPRREHASLENLSVDEVAAARDSDPSLLPRITFSWKTPSVSPPVKSTNGGPGILPSHKTPHDPHIRLPMNAPPLVSEPASPYEPELHSPQVSALAMHMDSHPPFTGPSTTPPSPPAGATFAPDPGATPRRPSPRASTPFIPDLGILSRNSPPQKNSGTGTTLHSGPVVMSLPSTISLDSASRVAVPSQFAEIVNADEGNSRAEMKIRGVDHMMGWYRSTSTEDIIRPPACDDVRRGDIFVHRNQISGKFQMWIWEGRWLRAKDNFVHPALPGHRLWLREDGEPRWLTRKTFNSYKKKASNFR